MNPLSFKSLNGQFSLKILGTLGYFLGIEVKSLHDDLLLLNQAKYVLDILSKTNMKGTSLFESYN